MRTHVEHRLDLRDTGGEREGHDPKVLRAPEPATHARGAHARLSRAQDAQLEATGRQHEHRYERDHEMLGPLRAQRSWVARCVCEPLGAHARDKRPFWTGTRPEQRGLRVTD